MGTIGLPEKFESRMKEMLKAEYGAFLACYERDREQALRINTCKLSLEDYLKISPFDLKEQVPWAEAAFYYSNDEHPGKHPHHEAGLYYIQEPSAMAAAGMLEVKPYDTVLDLCAAPGGKTSQIASALCGKGILLSNEIHPQRAKILSQNVERLGFRNVIVTNETPERLAERFEGCFDKVLVDAPCSGEGMFRKDEASRAQWSEDNVKMCAKRQDLILDCAVKMLKPQGRLVYSTCTFSAEENEGSISRLLERNRHMEIEDSVRLWPHKIKGEGHYAAALTKSDGYEGHFKEEEPLKEKLISKSYTEFAKRFFINPPNGRFYMFGDRQLYIVPDRMFSTDGLKVVRPGWHLGEMKKDRFEPEHSLAMGLDFEAGVLNALNTAALSSDSKEIYAYLRGETFESDGSDGWCAVTVDGYPTGLGKRVRGTVKNHYPKGLRLLKTSDVM